MNKPMDKQALYLITMMNHHLTHDYASEENKQRNLDSHLKEFKYFASLPVTDFSQNVWDEMNQLFNSWGDA
jgi:hypothetical protein